MPAPLARCRVLVATGTAGMLVAGALLAACSDGAGHGDAAGTGPEVTCTVAYRPTVTVSPDTQEGIEVAPGAVEVVEFDVVVITFTYDASEHEGWSLRIDASEPGADQHFTRTLYQFVDADPPRSFAGETGFTGLVYLYPPGSQAEAQYLCSAS